MKPETIDEAERIVMAEVDKDPLRHAHLVHDLIEDRRYAGRRGLAPAVIDRHRDDLLTAVGTIASQLMTAGRPDIGFKRFTGRAINAFAKARLQVAIARLVHHTHLHMVANGMGRAEDAAPLAMGRVLLAAVMAEEALRMLDARDPNASRRCAERAIAA